MRYSTSNPVPRFHRHAIDNAILCWVLAIIGYFLLAW
jgi:hypothetical protein